MDDIRYLAPKRFAQVSGMSLQTVCGGQPGVSLRALTAVPYAQISVHVLPSSDVSNRKATIASAPFASASSTSRSVAC